uniref:Coronin n=1 Tax=Buteo japonicus TaxID=224669 RepID=A0A8B9Z498_9AVES
ILPQMLPRGEPCPKRGCLRMRGTAWFPGLILVSASRDKTLRVWDLSRDGRSMRGCPRCWGTPG